MQIGIIGIGVVGGAVKHGLERIGHSITIYDPKYPETTLENIVGTKLCFICVPTNTLPNGGCDTSIVEQTVQSLAELGYKGLITIKSTVIPGTTERLAKTYPAVRLAFCPEFLRERAAVIDFYENQDICPIGAFTQEEYELVKAAHGTIPKSFSFLTPTEAELVKYFSNIFNALRITFANEFYEVCKKIGADYSAIKTCATKKQTITDYYLDANDHMRGFGGVCLPKDTRAFATFVKDLNLEHLKLFETIVAENEKFTTTIFSGMRTNGTSTTS